MSNNIAAHVPAVESALSQLLQTALNGEIPISIALGEPGEEPAVPPDARAVVCGDGSPRWVVHLVPEWIPLISSAILGEAMESNQPGVDDLLVEILGQAVGAVARSLGADGRRLPQDGLKAVPVGTAPPAIDGPSLTAVVVARVEDGELAAWVTFADPAAAAEVATPAQPAEVSAAPTANSVISEADVRVSSVAYQDFGPEIIQRGAGGSAGFDLLADVELDISVEIGRRNLPLADVLKLTTGSVIELEKLVGEPLEVYANGRLIAEGEAVVIDEQFGIRITRLASPAQRAKSVS